MLRDVRSIIRLAPKNLSGYNPFSKAMESMIKVMRFAKLGGLGTNWVIPTTLAAFESYQAYGTSDFGKTNAVGVGKVSGGLLGAWAGYGTCNLVLGAETAGTSVFWCAVIVGGVYGYGLSETGGQISGKIYDLATARLAQGLGTSGNQAMLQELVKSQQCTIPTLGN